MGTVPSPASASAGQPWLQLSLFSGNITQALPFASCRGLKCVHPPTPIHMLKSKSPVPNVNRFGEEIFKEVLSENKIIGLGPDPV